MLSLHLTLCWIWCLAQIVCVCSLEFSIYEIVSSTNRYSFTSPIPIWIHFISFFLDKLLILELLVQWWIEVVKTDIHSCLFPKSRRNNLQIPSSSIKYLTCNGQITLSSPFIFSLFSLILSTYNQVKRKEGYYEIRELKQVIGIDKITYVGEAELWVSFL